MLQTTESDILQQDLTGIDNVIPYSQSTMHNACPEWNLSDNTFSQEKEYTYGPLPCCTPLQGTYSDPSWNIGYQYNGNQYPPSACFLLDQSKRQPEVPPTPLLGELDSAPFMKDFIDNCPGIQKQGNCSNDYRLLNYPQPQSIYNPSYPVQEPLMYPPYSSNNSSNYGFCLEADCLDKLCSPSRSNFSSCILDQGLDMVNSESVPKVQNNGTTELSGLLSMTNPEDSNELRVNDSDDDSDIIVEDSDTDSEISIDVGPYIGDKEVVKVAVMRCLVCNLSYSDESQSNFVQVNSTFPLTFISQTPVMLKLIEIIPIDMQTSVKFENTLICRRCLNLIDTIESLEVRLVSVKKAICDYVSRSGKDVDDDLNILQGCNDLCINFDQNSPKEPNKDAEVTSSAVKMVSTGVNTDEIDKTTVSKERDKEPEVEKSISNVVEDPKIELRNFQCDRCGKMYKWAQELNHHLMKHAGKFTEKCTECGKGFMKSHNLELHMRKHRDHVCLHCRASFTIETDLTDHLLVCQESKFNCTKCTLLFTSKDKLEAHLEIHNKTPNVCNICSKEFKHPSGLETHMKSHSEEKHFACDKCGLKYKNQSHLRRHQKNHTNPFNCTTCRATFPTSVELQSHSLQHTEEIKCSECNKVFVSKFNLTEHKKIHSGTQSKRKCPVCKKLISYNFSAHVKSHSEEKKYKCEVCDTSFTFKHSMVKHMKLKHKLNNSG